MKQRSPESYLLVRVLRRASVLFLSLHNLNDTSSIDLSK